MLERLMSGWGGKVTVLVLLGFAATDFVITKTLSAADAAEHLIHNPFWPFHSQTPDGEINWRIAVTMMLLVFLGATFMRGFREVIALAVGIVGVFLLLNAIVIGSGISYLIDHPEKFDLWLHRVQTGDWHTHEPPLFHDTSWLGLALLSMLYFPKLALGLSGFETGVAVMPLIKGDSDDKPDRPKGRIRNTRKLLATAALIMSVYLLGSAIVVSVLIPPEALQMTEGMTRKPPAQDRALAYLAHGELGEPISPLFGETFGTLYDISTVVILWFAGASAMAGLLNLVPKYLPRYGMAPEWSAAIQPLVLLFTVINLFVTWVFDASVSAQGGAYATGVLVLMTSACVATVIERYRTREGPWLFRVPWFFSGILLVFLYTTIDVVIEKPEGIKIAAFFILAILVTSFTSRILRSRELRFNGFYIPDQNSKFLWESIQHLEFQVLVPHRPGRRSLEVKEQQIRQDHRLAPEIPILFVEVYLLDASEFIQQPWLEVIEQEGRFIMKITHAASIAHTLAAMGLEMARVGRPPEIHFGWTDETPLSGTLGFLLFGEGNVPWMVHDLIRRAEPDPSRRPHVIIAGP